MAVSNLINVFSKFAFNSPSPTDQDLSARDIDTSCGLLDVHGKHPIPSVIQRKESDPVTLFEYAKNRQTPESVSFQDLDVAKHRFDFFSGHLFDNAWRLGLPMIVAGGSVLRSLSKTDSPFFSDEEIGEELHRRDFDVWFCSSVADGIKTIEKMLTEIERIHCHRFGIVGAKWSDGRLIVDEGVNHVVVDFMTSFDKYRTCTRVDYILRPYKSILDILVSFDLDCTRFAYDGRKFYTTKTGLSAYKSKENQLNRSDLQHAAISRLMHRTIKYGTRGYSTKILDAPGAAALQSKLRDGDKPLHLELREPCLQKIIRCERYIFQDLRKFIDMARNTIVTNYQYPGLGNTTNESLDKWYHIDMKDEKLKQ